MKFEDLPLNVPVLITTESRPCSIVRLDEDIFLWNDFKNAIDITHSERSFNPSRWVNRTIIDTPTEADMKWLQTTFEAGYQDAVVNHSAPFDKKLSESDSFEPAQRLCTCPLYGAVSLLATGCRCGGK